MISNSEMFIQQREQDAQECHRRFRRHEATMLEYKNGKSYRKFNSADEEMDNRREQEMDDRFNGEGGEL